MLTVINNSICKLRRFLQPKQQSVTARTDPGKRGLK
jgi:hypothetical protein